MGKSFTILSIALGLLWPWPARAGFWDCLVRWAEVGSHSPKDLMNRYEWEDGAPPADFGAHVLPSFRRVPDGAVVRVVSPSERAAQCRLNGRESIDADTGQAIRLNGAHENYLLQESRKRYGSPEVLTARCYDAQGSVLAESPILAIGSSSQVSLQAAFDVMNRMRRPKGTTLVEIGHVHPGYEYAWEKDGKGETRISPLSEDDFRQMGHFIRGERVPVRFKAITPNGYNYSVVYDRSGRIPDPLPTAVPFHTQMADEAAKRFNEAAKRLGGGKVEERPVEEEEVDSEPKLSPEEAARRFNEMAKQLPKL